MKWWPVNSDSCRKSITSTKWTGWKGSPLKTQNLLSWQQLLKFQLNQLENGHLKIFISQKQKQPVLRERPLNPLTQIPVKTTLLRGFFWHAQSLWAYTKFDWVRLSLISERLIDYAWDIGLILHSGRTFCSAQCFSFDRLPLHVISYSLAYYIASQPARADCVIIVYNAHGRVNEEI